MELFVRAVTGLSRLCGVVAAGLIALAVVVICQMVFVRGVLGWSAIWQVEFVTFSLVAATFVGSPYVLLTRGHVNMDLLPHYLGPRARLALALAAAALALAFCLVLFGYGAVWWYETYRGGWTTNSIWRVRLWIPQASLPIGLGILALQYVADIHGLLVGRDPPFGLDPGSRR